MLEVRVALDCAFQDSVLKKVYRWTQKTLSALIYVCCERFTVKQHINSI